MKRHRTLVADSARPHLADAQSRDLVDGRPGSAEAHALPALTHVESISADGAPVDARDAIEIPAGRRRIAFSFTGLSLSVPERVRYRYRLDGFDHDWSEPAADRQAVYTNLGPGPYRFRVVASNSDGLWNGAEASLPFEIEPMVWQTRWFQAGAAVVCVAMAWGLYRLRVRQLARQLNIASRSVSRNARASPGTARHAAAGFPQRVDAAARRRRSAAGGLAGQAARSAARSI